MTPDLTLRSEKTAGVVYSFAAYVLWGVLPLYFLTVVPMGPWELVSWRVLFSFVFCIVLLTVTRGWTAVRVIIRQPKLLALTALAGVLIYVNWQVFVIATLTGHIVESSLGYFINPIVTVLLGVFVLRERIRSLQWVAIGIAAIAVIVIIVVYGSVPWIALSLTASFGVYGLVKKKIGPAVDAVSGLSLETMWLIPVAVVQLIVVSQLTGVTFGANGVGHMLLVSLSGVVTAVPLLLFAAGARRINLTVVGMIQFVTPVLQFLMGVFLLNEPMPIERWAGFLIVWVAIIVFIVDMMIAARRGRRTPQAELV